MKSRDWLVGALLVAVLGLFLWKADAPAPQPPYAPPQRPGIVQRVTKFIALWWLVREPIREEAEFQELPDALVNAAPERREGPDGEMILDFSDGW